MTRPLASGKAGTPAGATAGAAPVPGSGSDPGAGAGPAGDLAGAPAGVQTGVSGSAAHAPAGGAAGARAAFTGSPGFGETGGSGGRGRFTTLRMQGVSRRFGGMIALDRLDLTISGGEFLALLGPSGCGKSTALNCLAGLLPLSAGSISLDDERIDGLPPEKRGFGMVFQNYALFPHLSVRRNVAFGLNIRRVPKAEIRQRVQETLALVELTEHADKLPGQLSGGQQQRVAIARAIVIQPRLVLMDEPLSNLDAKLRLQMRTEIRRLHQSLGLTTVYVTHDQEEALALADRIVVLRGGRVEQVGTPEEVYTYPANTYVAGFMGYRNLLELPVTGRAERTVTLGQPGIRLVGVDQEGFSGDHAVAAVRPEDFRIAGSGSASDDGGPAGADAGRSSVRVRVEVVEFHGREVAAEGFTETGQVLHFRVQDRIAPGDEVELDVPADRVLVYGGEIPADIFAEEEA